MLEDEKDFSQKGPCVRGIRREAASFTQRNWTASRHLTACRAVKAELQKKKILDRPSIHRKEEPLEVFDLRQNIRGDAMMLFMQMRADRTGQAPKQIYKGASLSRAWTIPHESSTLKKPSESHLPKHYGLCNALGNKNKILLGHHCGLFGWILITY